MKRKIKTNKFNLISMILGKIVIIAGSYLILETVLIKIGMYILENCITTLS